MLNNLRQKKWLIYVIYQYDTAFEEVEFVAPKKEKAYL